MPLQQTLLIINTHSHFIELLRVARLLKDSKEYHPDLLFTYLPPSHDLKIADREGLKALDPSGKPFLQSETVSGHNGSPPNHDNHQSSNLKRRAWYLLESSPRKIKVFLYAAAHQLFLDRIYSLPFWLWYYAIRLQKARKLIQSERYRMVILAEDNVGYETAVWIKAAHERGVPAIIVPFTVATALEPAESVYKNPAYSLKKIGNRVAGRIHPHWVFTHKGRKLLRLPSSQVFAKEWLRISSPSPWMMNTGQADAIAVESERMLAHYRGQGILEGRTVLTGALTDDQLADSLRNVRSRRDRLCAELGLDPGRPLILCALPPDQFVFSGDQTDFRNYPDLVQFWIETLVEQSGWNIVVRLHPRADHASLEYIEKWGVKISQKDTAELVPLCDLFVASVSATIRWAIACGIPVINYDVYRLRYGDFSEVPGVLNMEDKEEFRASLRRITTIPSFYGEVRSKQESVMRQWGILDGKSSERMLELFKSTTIEREKVLT